MSGAVHICTFNGRRAEERPPYGTRCELSRGRGQGCKLAVGYAAYAWGAAALCEKHLAEECPAEEHKSATTAANEGGANG